MTHTVPVKHAAHPPPGQPRALTVLGTVAAVAAVTIGTVTLLRAPAAGITSVHKMTVTSLAAPFPLSAADLTAMLDQPPDLGPLGDPARRASCLSGLGYPASVPVLGARQVRDGGAAAVVLILAGEVPGDPAALAALVVPLTCSAADTGLLAETTVRRR